MFSKIKKSIKENTGILIRLDDIAENMNWDLMEKSELLFEKYQIKPILGVIPNNQDNDLLTYPKRDNFWEQVRKWKNKGWEISMHGSTHVYDKKTKNDDYFGYGGSSEFCGHSLEIQISKIKEGHFAVIKYSGRSSDKNFAMHSKILYEKLIEDQISIIGSPIKATYNGPFTLPPLRRNEAMFQVNWK